MGYYWSEEKLVGGPKDRVLTAMVEDQEAKIPDIRHVQAKYLIQSLNIVKGQVTY